MLRSTGIALAVTLALGIASCSSAPSPDSTPSTASTATVSEARDLSILRLLYSRAPVTLNPHLATGYQDFEAARIVYEPLASYNAAGELVPFLAAEIPTLENGGVDADGRSVTWKLRSDVTWSDGTPFTAADVVFTFEFIRNPEVAAATAQFYAAVDAVEAVDEHTVKITFTGPAPDWDVPFTGQTGLILPRHVFGELPTDNIRQAPENVQPVGTGPYLALGFESGLVIYGANSSYWDGPPAFEGIELVGGIAPYAAARDVLKTGQGDFAQNLQVEASALEALEAEGDGRIMTVFGSYVERIMVNFADPFTMTESGERASREVAHPYFQDIRVRRALQLAIDREAIVEELYGFTGRPAAQLLVAPERYRSEQLELTYDAEQAAALLSEAGWVDSDEDGIRDRNGVDLEVRFQAPVNPVRQKTQAMVKADLEAIGMRVEIERVRVDDFFSANPDQTKSLNHFYADLQMYSTGNESPDPTTYMSWWTCDKVASQENKWQEPNNSRYCSAEYDALWEAVDQELDPERRVELFQQMNELLVEDAVVLPVVHRAIANAVNGSLTGLQPTPWDASTWDIKRWQRRQP